MMRTDRATVRLPHGLFDEGTLHTEAALRALTGSDEAALLHDVDSQSPAERTTALLVRCLAGIGPVDDVTAEHVRALTVGDREALLLHLRRIVFGDQMDCVIDCPAPECGEKIDLELSIDELLLPPHTDSQTWYDATIRNSDVSYAVRFRLPTGGDQERAARRSIGDIEGSALDLVRDCVEEVREEGTGNPVAELPHAVFEQLPAVMAELDPQAELMLNVTCPSCERSFETLLDMGDFLYRELRSQMKGLYQDVHALAYHYHWSEAEIMGMTMTKRRRYLDLLFEALGGDEGHE